MGVGYLLNKNKTETVTSEPLYQQPAQPSYRQSVYQSNSYEMAKADEARRTADSYSKTKDAINTNRIPPYFNDAIYNDETAPNAFRVKQIRNANERELGNYFKPLLDENVHTKRDAMAPPSHEPIRPQYSELAGTTIDNFTHENMVPFFRGNNKQSIDPEANNSRLEFMNGTDKFYQSKTTIEPMFAPTKDLGYVYGTPNQVEAVMDRYIPSIYRQTEVPIEAIRVGPGLNQGYTSTPTGGFHQFDAQDFARPKTVDELRTLNNPKVSYEGRASGAPKATVTNRGLIGRVEKRLPDRFYVQGCERYLKTTGAYRKEEMRGQWDCKEQGREKSISYKGIPTLGIYGEGDKFNHGKDSITMKLNERMTTQDKTVMNNLTTTVKSIVAPILDIFRTTRKENVIGHPNKVGYLGVQAPSKLTARDPNDVAKATIKETNIHNERTGNIQLGRTKARVHDPNDLAKTTIKETNIHNERTGNIQLGRTKARVHDPSDIARKTIAETTLFNRDGHVTTAVKKTITHDPNDVMRTTVKETNIDNNHMGHVGRGTFQNGDGYMVADYEAPNTNRQFTGDYEYEGIAKNYVDRPSDDAMWKEARLNETKTGISEGRYPTLSNTKVAIGGEHVNIKINKLESDRENHYASNPDRLYIETPTLTPCEITTDKDVLCNDVLAERINPDYLEAFQKNPYTQSLQSYF